MNQSVVGEKSLLFAKRIVGCYRYLVKAKQEFVMSKQLLRCGTSIGANVAEAERGQSRADFISKMSIALKEANETENWLNIFRKSELIQDDVYLPIHNKLVKIKILLIKSIQTLKSKK